MKFTINFKTPDALYHALRNLSEDDQEIATEVSKKFVEYGEAVTIEIDTESNTAIVLPIR